PRRGTVDRARRRHDAEDPERADDRRVLPPRAGVRARMGTRGRPVRPARAAYDGDAPRPDESRARDLGGGRRFGAICGARPGHERGLDPDGGALSRAERYRRRRMTWLIRAATLPDGSRTDLIVDEDRIAESGTG